MPEVVDKALKADLLKWRDTQFATEFGLTLDLDEEEDFWGPDIFLGESIIDRIVSL